MRRSSLWSVADVEDGKCYQLLLCQSEDGKRVFRLNPVASSDNPHARDVKLKTEIVPNELLRRRNFSAISDSVALDNGERFHVDAHGVWLTETEYQSLISGHELSRIEWLDGAPPDFPPK
jgi:hypothetical protein